MFQSVTYQNFIDVFEKEIKSIYKDDKNKLKEVKSQLHWMDWVTKRGVPDMKYDFSIIFIKKFYIY